ncbi:MULTISPECIES: type II toxin-antitoxin system Phd/YefM family antitoxin [Sphingomonadaceae]|uniref:type II toxin-antitoxin system Phd/YefM family antitoxin n=1 Tax=Sphingomonadales TaxID=204457 RepID=UPI000770222B|nr:type II toxin-antitoxin system Phd/YefM family antitoxin [Sphingobium sp. TKS]AMK23255.1 prevent-host-death protein [Sphingobium sp. TKS]MCF8709069.1 type II toxin-antitoxin system Phd/YefM family antitoxin [Rhizorhapis sp. SPR117]
MRAETYGAADFKTNCLAILDRLARHDVDQVTITKRGRAVAVLTPPPSTTDAIEGLHGFMRGSVSVPTGVDLLAPVLDEPLNAQDGKLHG